MFDNWIKRNFPTVPDNDKPIDKKYIKDTFKEYFGKPKTQKAKLQNDLIHFQYVGIQNALLLIAFILYIWYEPFTTLIDSKIPNDAILGTNIFMFLGLVAVAFMVTDYIESMIATRKKIKELDNNHV